MSDTVYIVGFFVLLAIIGSLLAYHYVPAVKSGVDKLVAKIPGRGD